MIKTFKQNIAITSIAGALLLGLIGCRPDAGPPGSPPAGEADVAAAPIRAPIDLERGATRVICPQRWTCNHHLWFATEAECLTSCGPSCELDYRCAAGCVCP
jgi:hypothetical protein